MTYFQATFFEGKIGSSSDFWMVDTGLEKSVQNWKKIARFLKR